MIRKMFTLACLVAFFFAMVPLVISAPGSADQLSPSEDGTLKALAAIAGAGTMEDHAYQYLEELSDDIGARVTGSPAAAEAIRWGAEKMKAMGLENVHTESWQLSHSWTRISADAELVSPIRRRLMVDALGWVGSTPAGGVVADVIPVNKNQTEEELRNNAPTWRGKVILIVSKSGNSQARPAAPFVKFGDILTAAHTAGAVAVIGGQGGKKAEGMHLTHTGILGFDVYYDIPVVSMSAEDQDQLERYFDRGKSVRLKINVQNRLSEGPVESANVVGEIRGTEHPEQIIVVGGHLDSWDLSSGATDNGCGTTTTLGAAEAILKSGFKPRRTLRFVLFMGEEEGLLGSFAYSKTHKDEMANHVAAVVLDKGQGAVTGLQLGGRNDLIPAVEKFAAALQAFGKMDVNDTTEFGTDVVPFIVAGLPGIALEQDQPEYKYTHHSSVDTFDKVSADILDRNATVMALTAFWIADRPERLAIPWPAERTARMLIEKHNDGVLKTYNLWPFGDLGSKPESK